MAILNAGYRTLQARPNFDRNRPAALVLPPSQLASPLIGLQQQQKHMALRARQSPTMSLFNRLGAFVHQLQSSDQFFAHWPQRLCSRIRAAKMPPSGSPSLKLNATAIASQITQDLSTTCWNGHDFSGYSKPLVEFGQPVTINHPEVAVASAGPVATMVLNFIARLKEIGAQLKGRSQRSPHQLTSLYQHAPSDASALPSPQEVADFLHHPSFQEHDDDLSAFSSSPSPLDSLSSSPSSQDQDESEDGSQEDAGESSDDQEDDGPDVECHNEDCSDLNVVDQLNNNNQPRESSGEDSMTASELLPSVVVQSPVVTRRPIYVAINSGSNQADQGRLGRLGDVCSAAAAFYYHKTLSLVAALVASLLCSRRPHYA